MTVTRMLGFYFVLFLMFIAACSGGGRSNPSGTDLPNDVSKYLEGTIYGDDGKPLPDVEVKVTDLDGNLLAADKTDQYGKFKFDLDPTGSYKIFARTGSGSGSGWEYVYNDNMSQIQNPGQAISGGFVSLGTGVKISMPDGEIHPLSSPDSCEVNLGGSTPTTFTVRAVNSMFKIRPSTDLQNLDTYIQLAGARGEHEAFQVVPVLDPGETSIGGVEVSVSDLVKGANRILKSNITIYKEHYVQVSEPSDAGGATGLWPDALVPLTDPFNVQSNMPSPIWIDINIPSNAVPGVYSGQVKFSTPSDGAYSLNYCLKVWNITLPKKLNMKAEFGLDQEDIAAAHGLEPGLCTAGGLAMARKYATFLAQRHISTYGIPLFHPKAFLQPDNRSYTMDFTNMDDDISVYLEDYDLPVFCFPLDIFDCMPSGIIAKDDPMFSDNFNARFTSFVSQVSAHLSALGYLDRAYIQLNDEPSTSAEYQLVRDCYNLIHQSSPCPDFMVTEQPAPRNPSFGTLTDYVDIFTSGVRSFYTLGSEEAARTGGSNKKEWLYTNANVYPFPSLSIDKQGIETRLFVWFAYQHGFDGIFYYSANNWTLANPWVNPLTFGSAFGNGCGSLLYPGPVALTYTGQDNVDGPVSSIRLELIRDGLEDAQLLWMLGQGQPVPAADSLMTSWFDFSHNPDELLSIREQIADSVAN